MKRLILKSLLCVCLALCTTSLRAATKYWDINGATPGAGGPTPAGTWDTAASNWTTDSTGGSAATTWVAGDIAVFSAGTDALGAFIVTVTGTQTAASMTNEEGVVSIAGGAVALGAGTLTVNSGATLSTDSSLRISATAGAKLILNGATLRTTNPGAAGTFYDTDFAITLNGACTFSHTTANILNIVQTATTIGGTGSLTKAGAGVLAFAGTAGNNTYSGGTIVTDGELRIRTVPNTLPVTTALTVTSPGIFNLNGVSQQVGSLTGTGNVGTGSGTLTINGSASTTFDGALLNITNAGAGAVTTGNGRLIKNGTGTITFNGLNDINGSVTLSNGVITVSSGASLCGPICDLAVHGGTLNLNNAVQIIENLSGVGGTINLGSGHSLVASNAAASTYSGTIAGAGGIIKTNNGATQRTLTLSGPNSYDGNTLITGGKIAVGSATALGSAIGYTDVGSNGEVLFDAVTLTCAEPFRISGTGAGDGGAITIQNAAVVTISGAVTLTGDATNTVSSTATGTYNNAAAFTSLANQNLTLQGGSGAGGGGTISGTIALGSGGLTKLQGGTWKLTGNNNYDGATTVSAGTLRVGHNSALGSTVGPTTVASGATVSVDGSGLSVAEAISSLIGNGVSSGGALRNLANNNTWSGAITQGGAARINSDGGTLTVSGGISAGANALTVGGAGGIRIDTTGISGAGGSLIKDGTGTLELTVANSYDSGTTVSTGTLRVNNTTGSGTGTGSVTVNVGGTIGGNGTIGGALIVNGTVSPGDSVGALTNGTSVTFGGGGSYAWEINDATGGPGVGWDLLSVTGGIDVQATSGSKFTIKLQTLSGATPGNAANFTSPADTTYSWPIASVSDAITNFNAAAFTVNSSAFSNNVAGGHFVVDTNATQLLVRFVTNVPPVVVTDTNPRPAGVSLKIPISSLLANDTDADTAFVTDTLSLVSASSTSTNGASVSNDLTRVYYNPINDVLDTFTYTIQDSFGHQATGTVFVTIAASPSVPSPALLITTNNTALVTFGGIPGYNYEVQRGTNVSFTGMTRQWPTNAPSGGLFTVQDDFSDIGGPPPEAYYRNRYAP